MRRKRLRVKLTTLSQKNLIKLAKKDQDQGNIDSAIRNLEEALNDGHSTEFVLKLCELYLLNKQEDQAYFLIKEEPDLFSNSHVFDEYLRILQANNFFIEAKEVENLLNKKLEIEIVPVETSRQFKNMQEVRNSTSLSQIEYLKLLKLDLNNFKNFAQSILLDPSQNFALRIALCADLVRLGIKDTMKVLILGQEEEFIPAKANLLEKDPLFKEVISSLGDRFYHSPAQLGMMIGEANLVLGNLYPRLDKYVDEPDSFAKDLASYLQTSDGGSHQQLLEKVYANLFK